MRRPLLTSAAIASFLMAVLGVAIFLLFHNHTITQAAAEKIEVGMTLAQVESILGAPPGRYYRWRDPDVLHTEIDAKGMISEPVRTESWTTDDFRVIVALDDHERVTEFNHSPNLAQRTARLLPERRECDAEIPPRLAGVVAAGTQQLEDPLTAGGCEPCESRSSSWCGRRCS